MPIAHREIEIEIDDVDVGVERSSMNDPDESIWASGPNPPAAVTATTAAAAAAAIKAGDGQQQQDAGDDTSSHSSEGSLAELRQELPSTRLPVPRFQLRRQPSVPPTGFYLRVMKGEEVAKVAQICFDAFAEQNKQTGLIDEYPEGPPVDFFAYSHAHPDIVTVVACDPEGRLAGTNTIDLRDTVAGIGPVAVAPAWWDKKLGRFLMNGVLEQAKARGKQCIMLQQVANNVKSYALYARMEFMPVDACLSLEGFVYEYLEPDPEYEFRRLVPEDLDACDAMYQRLFPGFSRKNETRDAIEAGLQAAAKGDEGTVTHCVTRRGKAGNKVLAGFTTGLDLHGYVLAEDQEAYKALLTHASHHLRRHLGETATHAHMSSGGIAFHLMADIYPELLDWVFNVARLKIMEMTTLMAYGGPVPRVKEGSTLIYSPSVTY